MTLRPGSTRTHPSSDTIQLSRHHHSKHHVLFEMVYLYHSRLMLAGRSVRRGAISLDTVFKDIRTHGGHQDLTYPEELLDPDAAPHGWQFAYIYYVLVRYVLGAGKGRELVELYRKHGVRWRPKRKVTPSPAQLGALRRARLERNRDAIEERWARARSRARPRKVKL